MGNQYNFFKEVEIIDGALKFTSPQLTQLLSLLSGGTSNTTNITNNYVTQPTKESKKIIQYHYYRSKQPIKITSNECNNNRCKQQPDNEVKVIRIDLNSPLEKAKQSCRSYVTTSVDYQKCVERERIRYQNKIDDLVIVKEDPIEVKPIKVINSGVSSIVINKK